jgi:hypothetical protein
MGKCANISPYMRKPLVIYVFATAPFWISLYMRKIWFSFFTSVKHLIFLSLRFSSSSSLRHFVPHYLPVPTSPPPSPLLSGSPRHPSLVIIWKGLGHQMNIILKVKLVLSFHAQKVCTFLGRLLKVKYKFWKHLNIVPYVALKFLCSFSYLSLVNFRLCFSAIGQFLRWLYHSYLPEQFLG